jgi:hypothetical protein
LKNGGTLERAAAMADHASTRTTQLYDRRSDEVSLDEVERVAIWAPTNGDAEPMIGSILREWVLQPQYLTAWLQALAAIVALGISAWAVLRQGAMERRRNRQEMNTLAVAIYPEIGMLKISLQTARERITKLRATYAGVVGQSIGATLQASAYVGMVPMIERNIDRLYISGDVAGPTCIHLARLIIQHNVTV